MFMMPLFQRKQKVKPGDFTWQQPILGLTSVILLLCVMAYAYSSFFSVRTGVDYCYLAASVTASSASGIPTAIPFGASQAGIFFAGIIANLSPGSAVSSLTLILLLVIATWFSIYGICRRWSIPFGGASQLALAALFTWSYVGLNPIGGLQLFSPIVTFENTGALVTVFTLLGTTILSGSTGVRLWIQRVLIGLLALITSAFFPSATLIASTAVLGILLIVVVLFRRGEPAYRWNLSIAFIGLTLGSLYSLLELLRHASPALEFSIPRTADTGVDALGLIVILIMAACISTLVDWSVQRKSLLIRWLIGLIIGSMLLNAVIPTIDPLPWRTASARTVVFSLAALLIGILPGIILYRWRVVRAGNNPRGLRSISAVILILLSFIPILGTLSHLAEIPMQREYSNQIKEREQTIRTAITAGEDDIRLVRINDREVYEPARLPTDPSNVCAAIYYRVNSFAAP